MSKVQPLGSRVFAEPLKAPEKTESGIYIPDSAKDKPEVAKVVAVGKNTKEVKVGDVIIHEAYGTKKIDNKEYVVVKEKDILGILK